MQTHPSHLSPHIENVLLRSKRRCALCFANGITQVRQGSIVHLTQESINNDEDDLVFLCADHYASIEAGEAWTVSEIKAARNSLYSAMGVADELVARPKASWLQFEERVAEVLNEEFRRSSGESFVLYSGMMIPSHLGGALRKVDLAAEFTVAGIKFLMVIKVKFVRGKLGVKELGVKELGELYQLMQDVGANKGLLVTNGDFTADAIHFASTKGLALMTIRDDLEQLNGKVGAKSLEAKPKILRVVS